MTSRTFLVAATAAIVLVAGACRRPAAVEKMPTRPLAGMLAQALVVFPVHYLRTGDSIEWSGRISESRVWLAEFDSTFEAVLKRRGIPETWRFPPELARMQQRNSGYVSNPYQLAAQALRPPARDMRETLTDPLAGQVRSWTALNQARTALLPIEIRFEGRRDSAQAVLRVAVIDAMRYRVSWISDVKSDFGSGPNSALLTSLARHLADLIAQP